MIARNSVGTSRAAVIDCELVLSRKLSLHLGHHRSHISNSALLPRIHRRVILNETNGSAYINNRRHVRIDGVLKRILLDLLINSHCGRYPYQEAQRANIDSEIR